MTVCSVATTNEQNVDTQVGLQAAKRIQPHSLVELATANSIMRLMVTDGEQPIDTYIRYKNDISEWYKCMREEYHLTEVEIKVVEPYLLPVYGVGDTQEIVMELSMDEHIANFSVAESNKLRKSIAKKDKELQQKMKHTFFEAGRGIGTSDNLLNYIWNEVVGKQLGYSFSKNHTFPYSCIGVQELNLAYHYPIIYWNTACLIVDAGADEEVEENKSTDYGKIATAISNMQKRNIPIALPYINQANFGFYPDEENNRIIYALKAINGIGDDVVRILLENRPYRDMQDFYERMIKTKLVKNSQMMQLIKAGVFDEISNTDRIELMKAYISEFLVSKCNALGMQQFNKLLVLNEKYNFIPEKLQLAIRHVNFKKYVLDDYFFYKNVIIDGKKVPKAGYHDRLFKLDETSMRFFIQYYSEDSVEAVIDEFYVISEKRFIKENKTHIAPLKEWLTLETTLEQYNNYLVQEALEENASGTLSKWEMDSLSIYATTEHELKNMKDNMYGIEDFYEMPEEPEIYDTYTKRIKIKEGDTWRTEVKEFPKYRIKRISGTVLDKNKDKHLVTLLTKSGVVMVKFNKGQFVHYDQQISSIDENGNKKVLEKSWFKRGNKIVVCGYRQGDIFRAYKYADSAYKHSCMLIKRVNDDGSILASVERLNINE